MTGHNHKKGTIMAKTNKVRVTQFPDQVLEVSDAELLDLQRQGLIFEGKAAEAKELVADASVPVEDDNRKAGS